MRIHNPNALSLHVSSQSNHHYPCVHYAKTCPARGFTTRKLVRHVCSLHENLSRTCVHYASIFVFHVCSLLLHVRLLTYLQGLFCFFIYVFQNMQGVFKNHLRHVWFILLTVEYQNVVKCKQNSNTNVIHGLFI